MEDWCLTPEIQLLCRNITVEYPQMMRMPYMSWSKLRHVRGSRLMITRGTKTHEKQASWEKYSQLWVEY
ncbi:hypothetical protein CR513_16230, partial [Mucuna pruriens]